MTIKNMTGKIPDILLAFVTSFSLVYALTSSLCLTYHPMKLLLLVILCVTALIGCFLNRKTTVATIIILVSALSAGVLYIAFRIGIKDVLFFLDGYFYWLGDFIQYPGVPDPLYQTITVMVLSLLMSAFSYIFMIRRFSFYVLLAAGMGLFTVQWSYRIFSSMIPFYLYLLVTFMAYMKHISILKGRKTEHDYVKSGMAMIWGLPVCVFIIILAFTMHASDKPIEWKWLDQKIVSAYNYFSRNFDYEAFDYFSLTNSSGFGDRNNILGGRVKLDRTYVLRVSTNQNIYLKGITKDHYTGSSWINSIPGNTVIEQDFSAVYKDTEEMLQGMKLLTGKEDFLEEYFDVNEVSVTFMNLKTKSLFIPLKTTQFSPGKDSFTGLINHTGDLSGSIRQSKGFKYTLKMYNPKIGTEEFAETMRKSRKGLYKDEEFTELEESSAQIYNEYLQIPQDIPQRIKDLSASLVASKSNNYDKAKAIEQYLASNYPYNLDVRSTPRNRDFVDYFLFDLKEGYCSYYASAMTILARCAGLPARYVEGYMLPPEPTKDNRTTYLVTNMQAHAWVEIYFEGYGWLPFEPTSPFRTNFYSTEISSPLYAEGYASAYEDYMEMMRMYAGEGTGFAYDGAESQENFSEIYMIVAFIGAILLLISLLLLSNMLRSRYRLYKLLNLPAKDCILDLYEYYISVLKLQGIPLEPGETPFQYSERIDSLLLFDPVKFKVITEIFVKARYSLQEISEKEKELLCDFYTSFLNESKQNMGRFNYFFTKYVFGKL